MDTLMTLSTIGLSAIGLIILGGAVFAIVIIEKSRQIIPVRF
tara:strand:- start:17496 stop:17621 length:126 start_codon:yes stop_codon:yes gene_type:complete